MRVRTRLLTLAVAGSIGVTGGSVMPAEASVPGASAQAQAAQASPPESPQEQALAQARRTDKRVEILDERGESKQVFADPDGTLTEVTTAGPQRVRRDDGSWAALDPTLVRRADGSIGPRAATVDLTFSDGGATPLVELGEGAAELSLSWPGALPEPVLDGDTATYREVLPGVDVRVRAKVSGYAYLLVVKNAEAAAALDDAGLKLEAKTENLTLTTGPGGGLRAVDPRGGIVFEGASPAMWDSSGEAAARAGKPALGVAAGEAAVPADPSDGVSVGDQVAPVDVTVANGDVVLVPDQRLLHDDDVAYPLFIDPDVGLSKSDYVYVSSGWPNTVNHNWGDDDEGVGRCTSECSSSAFTNRMYFRFKVSASTWAARTVSKAVFRAKETWSYSCSPSGVRINLVDESKVNDATTWNNKPALGDHLGDRNVSYGRNTKCSPAQPASWVEFKDNPDETDENLTAVVRSKLAAGAAIGIGLSASDETSANSWKRFEANTAELSVTYNTKPDAPKALGTAEPTTSCVSGSSRPFIRYPYATLRASGSDADPQNLTATFEVTDRTSGAVRTYKDGPQSDTTVFTYPLTGLVHGRVYAWRVKTNDGINDSVGWSSTCEFAVDTQAPSMPSISSTDFPDSGTNLKVGQAGVFQFVPGTTVDTMYGKDVAYYEWGLLNDNPTTRATPASLGASASASITPSSFKLQTLYVRSVDRAGNRSAVATYSFRPARPCADLAGIDCTVAAYTFDEATGTTTADKSGGASTLAIDGATWVAGRPLDGAASTGGVQFDGVDDSGRASPVVDTSRSFTVAAWVKLDVTGARDQVVVSQSGTNTSGFELRYKGSTQRWSFARRSQDSATSDVVEAVTPAGTALPVAGRWTHLAGVFKANAKTLTLYVNGEEQQTVPVSWAGWNAWDKLRVGHAKVDGALGSWLDGTVDDVLVFPLEMDAFDITTLARQ